MMRPPPYDPDSIGDRAHMVKAVAEELLGMGAMEELATWTRYRVLYVPVREVGRVCVRIPVVRGDPSRPWGTVESEWGVRTIQLSHRFRREDYDLILCHREVHLKGDIPGIVRRVRSATLEGIGFLNSYIV
ncbi:MAG: hypothetical protein EBT79_10305 [Actinobacteria bacterium]|nr:hypothetical protein [Actinomycetota bacterium]NBR67646.1 hypothetical protein [Actinomycetota bacterium]